MSSADNRLAFEIPLLPPSVNHYVTHSQRGGKTIHRKTPEAEAFEASFMAMLPAEVRGRYVVADRFHIGLVIYPGPGDKGDIDNFPKLLLDCIAKAGMLRRPRLKIAAALIRNLDKDIASEEASDSWVKQLSIRIRDDERDRKEGPKVYVIIEVLP